MWITKHILLSALLSLFYFLIAKDVLGTLLLFVFGSFLDIDHYLFMIAKLRMLNPTKVFKYYKNLYDKKMTDDYEDKYVLLLHNFEFNIAVSILSFYISFFIPVAIGSLSHFLSDVAVIRKFKIKHYYSAFYWIYRRIRFRR